MGLKDLLEGMDHLDRGVSRFGQSLHTIKARRQAGAINEEYDKQAFSLKDRIGLLDKDAKDYNEQRLRLQDQIDNLEFDRTNQLSQVSQNLALGLSATGADAASINAATSAIAPSQGALFQAKVNSKLQKDNQEFQAKWNAIDNALRWKIANLKANKDKEKGLSQFTEVKRKAGLGDDSKPNQEKVAQTQEKVLGLLKQVNDYRNHFNKNGLATFGTEASDATAMREKIKLTYKELMNLGVLQKIDDEKLDMVVPNMVHFFRGPLTADKVRSQFNLFSKGVANDFESALAARGYEIDSASQTGQLMSVLRSGGSIKESILYNPEVALMRDEMRIRLANNPNDPIGIQLRESLESLGTSPALSTGIVIEPAKQKKKVKKGRRKEKQKTLKFKNLKKIDIQF